MTLEVKTLPSYQDRHQTWEGPELQMLGNLNCYWRFIAWQLGS